MRITKGINPRKKRGFEIVIDDYLAKNTRVNPKEFANKTLSVSERQLVLDAVGKRRNMGIKYSRQMLDHAVKLSFKIGVAQASNKTGVKYWSLRGHRRDMVRRGEVPNNTCKKRTKYIYTKEQKIQCVKIAIDLYRTGGTRLAPDNPNSAQQAIFGIRKKMRWPIVRAFKEAGRRIGVNGGSIYYQWNIGMLDDFFSPTSIYRRMNGDIIKDNS